MKKVKLLTPISLVLVSLIFVFDFFNKEQIKTDQASKTVIPVKKEKVKKKKTIEERQRTVKERWKHEFNLQVNPNTGEIPLREKQKERLMAKSIMSKAKTSKSLNSASFISRGPSNFGGRTRSLVIDKNDPTSSTMIAGGVSSGVFRTTDAGANWTKVSSNNEIHNVTTIAQDPRDGFENIWYYGTGELLGNSASAVSGGAFYLGQGIWQSIDNGITWNQIPSTSSTQESFDSDFDIIFKIVVHPITGDLYAATYGKILRFNGTDWSLELNARGDFISDLVITNAGIVYAAFAGNSSVNNGVWRSDANGLAPYTRLGSNATTGFDSNGRMVLAVAPSNENIIYALHTRNNVIAGGLWQWNNSSELWINYTSKVPDLPGGDLDGVDPFNSQGGYDLVISVKPDDPNFVVIGGTNAYRVQDITTGDFELIGGYRFDTSDGIDNADFALYDFGGGDEHHPDIHVLEFDPNDPDILFSGTDGGIHRANATDPVVSWTDLNNNYQTYQYYHVAMDSQAGSDFVLGGAQDNGTTAGGVSVGLPNSTVMTSVGGGDGASVAISNENAPDDLLFYLSFQNGDMFRSNDFAIEISPDGSDSQFVTYFYLDPSNNNALYYAGENILYSTSDAANITSTTWNNLGSFASNENITRFTTTWGDYNTSESYLLIGGQQGSLFRLDDPLNATAASDAVEITPTNGGVGVVSGIAVHPTNRNIVMLTYSNYGVTSIFLTTNATDANPTWTVAERNLGTFSIRSTAITEVDGETRYFVGTARGLYSNLDPVNEDWEIEGPDQIGFAVVSSLVYRPADNKLLVGTHGNGMYEATIGSTLSIEEFDTTDSKFVFWPNPANDVINVEVENTFVKGDLDFSVFSIDGKEIKTGVLNSNKQINVDNIPKGNYILQIRSEQTDKAVIFNKN